MPQFELDRVGISECSGRVRGRDAADAVRRALDLGAEADVEVGDADLHGWRDVAVDGAPSGRLREHQRMRFRRD